MARWNSKSQSHKPIFHCNVNPFALRSHVGLDPQCKNFALGVPKCWYLNTFADPAANPHTPNANPCTPNVRPNMSQWNIVPVGYARVGFLLGM